MKIGMFYYKVILNSILNNEVYDECTDNVIFKWNEWKSEFLRVSDKHAPIKECRLKNRCNPWITKELIQLMYKRDYFHKKATQCQNNDTYWEAYKELRNRVTKQCNKAKKDYFVNLLEENKHDTKKTWKVIKKITDGNNIRQELPQCLNAESMNEYFSTIGEKVACSITKKNNAARWKNPECIYKFQFSEISHSCVYSQLKELDTDSSLDILGFDSKLLNIAADFISASLSRIFNCSIKSGILPDDWKLARITPVYKGSGCRFQETNYRPISVLPHVAKILEREVHSQFIIYLIKHDFISVDQSAYMKHHSTHTFAQSG